MIPEPRASMALVVRDKPSVSHSHRLTLPGRFYAIPPLTEIICAVM
jgi:hypothetical protein